jgi:probable rRNA maturation factor
MSIFYHNEDVKVPKLKKRITSEWIKRVVQEQEKKVGDISIIFCSDDYLLDVNRKYLEHDYFTDIITFDYVEGDLVSGDIFISVDRVKENSETFNTSFEKELNRIMIHGILHLLGFKDKDADDKKRMTEMEDICINKLISN